MSFFVFWPLTKEASFQPVSQPFAEFVCTSILLLCSSFLCLTYFSKIKSKQTNKRKFQTTYVLGINLKKSEPLNLYTIRLVGLGKVYKNRGIRQVLL